ncbi:MAG TPA: BMP family ABC transporter substrate-binding protein [Streptosporangiaceae bacterium]|nr:BMP family ABC transporter substrate-binding protein [Streptosporangiaceae bacterium]
MRQTVPAVAALSLLALLAAACGSSTTTSPGSSTASAAAGPKFKACVVSDTGTINDKSFNQSAYEGATQAAAASHGKITAQFLPSASSSDYASNITTFINQNCGIIVTVGFLMGDATSSAAKSNASQKFAIVDFTYPKPFKNVSALVFNTVEDGFMGGYLAAGMSKTKKVATFGGQKLPTVTIYMDGFWDGVQYYNQRHHANVQVLGWNEKTQNGSFTGNFTDLTAGQRLTNTFISEGADIIFPVAGNVGLGAAKAVQNADAAAGTQKVNMMWVDTDGCISAAQYCKYFITSINKGITVAVRNAVTTAQNGTFKGGNYVGTLANGGVGLAPYHDFASKVPPALQSELAQIKADIISGKIKPATKSPV